jgi:hypothetical protein
MTLPPFKWLHPMLFFPAPESRHWALDPDFVSLSPTHPAALGLFIDCAGDLQGLRGVSGEEPCKTKTKGTSRGNYCGNCVKAWTPEGIWLGKGWFQPGYAFWFMGQGLLLSWLSGRSPGP